MIQYLQNLNLVWAIKDSMLKDKSSWTAVVDLLELCGHDVYFDQNNFTDGNDGTIWVDLNLQTKQVTVTCHVHFSYYLREKIYTLVETKKTGISTLYDGSLRKADFSCWVAEQITTFLLKLSSWKMQCMQKGETFAQEVNTGEVVFEGDLKDVHR